jgi:hypothetical protein
MGYTEVPCLSHSVDLVLEVSEALIAVEFKLSDWRRGLSQAEHHLIAFDYCYVCLPKRTITASIREAFSKSGIGLLLVEEAVGRIALTEVISPRLSTRKWHVAERWVRDAFGGRRLQP